MRKALLLTAGVLVAAAVVPALRLWGQAGDGGGAQTQPVVRIEDPNAVPGGAGAAGGVGMAGGAATRPMHTKTDQMRGFSMQLQRPQGDTASELKAIDDLADMGCTWINLAIAGRQDDVKAEAITWDYTLTPSQDDVKKVMKRAKERGMGIMLMPMVLLRHSGPKDWRGVIDPPNWDNWFMSYNHFICEMAQVAKDGDADIFVVGSELLSSEPFRDHWVDVIHNIKQIYKGKLTYSSNWDHYEKVTFWDQLDYVGMNNYNELAQSPDATVQDLDKAWEPIKKKILDFAASQHKPFMFTEVGWHNLACTLSQPWNYVAEGPIDHGPQTHAFQSFVDSWHTVPKSQFMGAFIWEWCPLGHVTDHGTYSLQDTPALPIVRGWFAEP